MVSRFAPNRIIDKDGSVGVDRNVVCFHLTVVCFIDDLISDAECAVGERNCLFTILRPISNDNWSSCDQFNAALVSQICIVKPCFRTSATI
jgi:hypothetical protein